MSKGKNEVAVQEQSTELALAGGIDFGADCNVGMEGAGAESFAIPFLAVLQKISPQCDEAEAKYIEGAKGGQLFNSVTEQLFDGKTGLHFLPAAYQRRFLRWGPRGGENSGFKGEMSVEQVATMRENNELIEQDGKLYFPLEDGSINDKKCDVVTDVRNHFGILVDSATGAFSQVLVSLSSTQIKKSKHLMSLLSGVKVARNGQMVTPPTWLNKVKVTTVPESNSKGSWYGIKFELDGFCDSAEQYQEAKKFHAAVSGGTAGPINYESVAAEQASDKF